MQHSIFFLIVVRNLRKAIDKPFYYLSIARRTVDYMPLWYGSVKILFINWEVLNGKNIMGFISSMLGGRLYIHDIFWLGCIAGSTMILHYFLVDSSDIPNRVWYP